METGQSENEREGLRAEQASRPRIQHCHSAAAPSCARHAEDEDQNLQEGCRMCGGRAEKLHCGCVLIDPQPVTAALELVGLTEGKRLGKSEAECKKGARDDKRREGRLEKRRGKRREKEREKERARAGEEETLLVERKEALGNHAVAFWRKESTPRQPIKHENPKASIRKTCRRTRVD
eukprot:953031-Rhodomonas_salina.2